jgi:hypothetical protein
LFTIRRPNTSPFDLQMIPGRCVTLPVEQNPGRCALAVVPQGGLILMAARPGEELQPVCGGSGFLLVNFSFNV